MATQLKTKPGINGANTLSIPAQWDSAWFRKFIANSLKGADVRNAVGTNGVVVSGNIASPYATIGLGVGTTFVAGSNVTITSSGGVVTVSSTGGGGSTQFNVTPDTHPSVPTGVGLGPNDEFEYGSTVDTTGARYVGATPWTAFNLSTASGSLSQGILTFLPALTASLSVNGYTQPAPTGSWEYTAKFSQYNPSSASGLGLVVATASGAAGNFISYNVNSAILEVQHFSNSSTFVSTVYSSTGAYPAITGYDSTAYPWVYLKINYNGTTLSFSISFTGIPGTFKPVYSETSASFLGTPGLIGFIGTEQSNIVQSAANYDWFRRTA